MKKLPTALDEAAAFAKNTRQISVVIEIETVPTFVLLTATEEEIRETFLSLVCMQPRLAGIAKEFRVRVLSPEKPKVV